MAPASYSSASRCGCRRARKVFDVSAEEREPSTKTRGPTARLHIGGSFSDLMTDEKANDTLREFLERKIRSIVKDPDVANLLIPTNHPPFTRRPCGESGYYETFNRDNVTLVDAQERPDRRDHPGRAHAWRAAPSSTSTCSSAPPASTPAPAA